MGKKEILDNIVENFNLNKNEAKIALAILEERALSTGFETVEDYMSAYYPRGFSVINKKLSKREQGFIQYFHQDARAIIHAGKNSDFQTFLRASATSFRRQLSDDQQARLEKVFGVQNNQWTHEQSLAFAIGFEEYVKYRFASNDEKPYYEKKEEFDNLVSQKITFIKLDDTIATYGEADGEYKIKPLTDKGIEKFLNSPFF